MGGSYDSKTARLESKLFSVLTSDVKVAKRKLKYKCGICGKPILKGQKYVKRRKFVGLGYAIQYAHTECLDSETQKDND